MKKTMKLVLVVVLAIMTGCASPAGDGLVTAKVKTVEQVPNYTYLEVKAKGPAYWVALPTKEIAVGSVISYRGGMLMEDFQSKELNRTFEKILFLEGLDGDSPSGMGIANRVLNSRDSSSFSFFCIWVMLRPSPTSPRP